MKILQVILFFSPKFGGSVTVPYQLSKELSKRGHDVTIITTDFGFDSEYAKTIEGSGVRVIPFRTIVNFGPFIYTPSIKPWLRENIRKFDVIHMHDFRSYQNIVIHSIAIKYGIPYIVQAHGSVPLNHKKIQKKGFDLLWGHRLLKNAAQAIALTRTEKDQYIAIGVDGKNISIIPNGIDPATYDQPQLKGLFKQIYDIPSNFKIILYLGRLHKSKGIDLLIESFIETRKKIKNIKLVIIGPDDGFKETLNDLINRFQIKKDVILLDFISNKEKISAFFDADVFVTPKFSGFPITFLEACVCGTPIVTTENGDTLEWINNKVGFVVEYDKNQLHDKIHEILINESLKKKFGDEGKKLIIDRFNLAKIASDNERIYEKCLRKK